MTDLREIGPTFYFAPPRVFENLLTQVMIRMEDAGAIKRRAFHYFMDVARRCGAEVLDEKPGIALADRLLYAIGNAVIYGPLAAVVIGVLMVLGGRHHNTQVSQPVRPFFHHRRRHGRGHDRALLPPASTFSGRGVKYSA